MVFLQYKIDSKQTCFSFTKEDSVSNWTSQWTPKKVLAVFRHLTKIFASNFFIIIIKTLRTPQGTISSHVLTYILRVLNTSKVALFQSNILVHWVKNEFQPLRRFRIVSEPRQLAIQNPEQYPEMAKKFMKSTKPTLRTFP